MTMTFEKQICDVKDQVPSSSSISEEETATPTPRSMSDSYNESSSETPRSPSKSDAEDDYYAFLRELAGSFVEEQDSGSELGSEDGAGTEEEDEECEPTPSTLKLDGVPPTSRLLPPACWQDGGRQGSSTSLGKAELGKGQDTRWSSSKRSSASRPAEEAGQQQQRPSASAGSCSRQFSSCAGGDRVAVPAHDDGRCRASTPSRDHRSPVEDDYDVVQAVQHFASKRAGSRLQQQREDLQASISQKLAQAQNLLGVASSPHIGLSLREHYSRVHHELLEEARELEAELAALGEEAGSETGESHEIKESAFKAHAVVPAVPPLVQMPLGGCAGDTKAVSALGLDSSEICQVACG